MNARMNDRVGVHHVNTANIVVLKSKRAERVSLSRDREDLISVVSSDFTLLGFCLRSTILALFFVFCDSMKMRPERKFILSIDAEHGLPINKVRYLCEKFLSAFY
jgi:hypothetical protein